MESQMSQMFDPTQSLREKALRFADEAAHEADYHRRRQLEEAAMAYWRAARREPGPPAKEPH